MQIQADPYASQTSLVRRYLGAGIILLVASVLIGFIGVSFLRASKQLPKPLTMAAQKATAPVTQATGDVPDSVTQATGVSPDAVTQATGQSPTPITQATGTPAAVTMDPETVKKMPKDVLDWLKHLERIEKLRKDMGTEQIASLLSQLAMLQGIGATEEAMKGLLDDGSEGEPTPPSKQISDEATAQKAKWRALIADFDSLPPPTECVSIRNAYSQCLGETQAMIGEVLDAVRAAGEDPKAAVASLMKMRGKSAERIDIAAKESDGGVQDVCDKYDVKKWFSVSGDVGGGMGNILGGLGGMLKQ